MNRRNFLKIPALATLLPFLKPTPVEAKPKPIFFTSDVHFQHSDIILTGIKSFDNAVGGLRKGELGTISIDHAFDGVSKYLRQQLAGKPVRIVDDMFGASQLERSLTYRKLISDEYATLLLTCPSAFSSRPVPINSVALYYISSFYVCCVDHLGQCVVTKNRHGAYRDGDCYITFQLPIKENA